MAEHPALAMLEILVHLDLHPQEIPDDYVIVKVSIGGGVSMKRLAEDISSNNSETETGDKWLTDGDAAILIVPSAVMPYSENILLNPLHIAAEDVSIVEITPFEFDQRLLRFHGAF